jgi:hypothetical protein
LIATLHFDDVPAADHRTTTSLAGYLNGCAQGGLRHRVIEDACRGIDLNGSLAASWVSMTAIGVHRIRSTDIGIFS